jgi:hypothetical protein
MTDERIIAYLLKELSEEELEQFEDECFEQESWPAQIQLAEEDLVDAYLRDELSLKRRERFEQNYLTTEARQDRVRMAAALLRRVDKYNAEHEAAVVTPRANVGLAERLRAFWAGRTFALRAGMAVVIAAAFCGALWVYLSRGRSPQTFATLTLSVSRSNRSEGAQTGNVKLPLGTDALRIALTLPDKSPAASRYIVEMESEGGEIRSLDVAEQDARSVQVIIPASQLTRGRFTFKLSAVNSGRDVRRVGGNYFLTVE